MPIAKKPGLEPYRFFAFPTFDVIWGADVALALHSDECKVCKVVAQQ